MFYYIIDTETTGLSAGFHEIFEISIIREIDRHQLSRNIKIQFPERASAEALKITNKKISELLIGESKEKVIQDIEDFLSLDKSSPEHRVFVAHNASFDQRFCHALWASANKKFPADYWLDTKEISRMWQKKNGIQKPELSLTASLVKNGLQAIPGQHNAIVDARNAYILYKSAKEAKIDYLPLIKKKSHNLTIFQEEDI
jgi:DNA polymerase III epsilon subunit-like protein